MQGQLNQTIPLEAEASATALEPWQIRPDPVPEAGPSVDADQSSTTTPSATEDFPWRDEQLSPTTEQLPPTTEQLPPTTEQLPPTTEQLPPEDSTAEVKEAYRVANVFEHMADLVGNLIGIKNAKRISNDSTEKLYGKHPEKGWNWALGYEKSPQSAVTLNKANRTVAIVVLLLLGFTLYGFIWATFVKPQIENAQAEGTNSIYIPGSYAVPNGAPAAPITGQYAPTPLHQGPTQFGQLPMQPAMQQPLQPMPPSMQQPMQPINQLFGQPHSMPSSGHYQQIPQSANNSQYAQVQPYTQQYGAYPQNNFGYPSAQPQPYTFASGASNYSFAPRQQFLPPPVYAPSPDHAYGQPQSVYPPQQGFAPPAIPAYPNQFGAQPAMEDRSRVRVITGR